MTPEVKAGIEELMGKLRAAAKEAAEHEASAGMVGLPTAQHLADSVVFSVLCELDNCAYDGHSYNLIREDGLNLSNGGLHDYYFQRPKP